MSHVNNTEISLETAESAQLILQNVAVLSELTSHLMNETKNGENCLNSLNNLLRQAGKDLTSLHDCVNSLLLIAKRLVHLSLQIVPIKDPTFKSLKTEADKLLNALDETKDNENDKPETRWRQLGQCRGSLKCLIDDKYPERCSRESLLDISNVVGLPTVPEDAFANFQRPSRTLSSCSLKNVRKIKLCLQKAYGTDKKEEFSPCSLSKGSRKKNIDSINANTQTVAFPTTTMSTGTDAISSAELNSEENVQ